MEQVDREAMAAPYDLLRGRKTYEIFASHFSNPDTDFTGNLLHEAKKYVVTSTLDQPAWNNSEAVIGDVATEIAKLKKQDGPLLQVHGS